MIETHPFEPFVPKNALYLLLGSFTGVRKEKDENYDWYYGTKRNQFWSIIEAVYDTKLENIKDKQQLLTKNKIAISDLIYRCERKKGNNLDSNLRILKYNTTAIEKVLQSNKIKKVYFTSRFVEKIYKKQFVHLISAYPTIELITLPSPSPRYAQITKNQKIDLYKKLLLAGF